jgi:hypothetical protein
MEDLLKLISVIGGTVVLLVKTVLSPGPGDIGVNS